MRELEATLQQFGEFLLKGRLVKENAAPYCVRWVRRFLMRPASTDPLGDQVRHFCEDLEREGCQDRQVRQAEQALRIYWLNFRRTTDWVRRPAAAPATGRVEPLAALDELRRRIRTRHYSYRTEVAYVDCDLCVLLGVLGALGALRAKKPSARAEVTAAAAAAGTR